MPPVRESRDASATSQRGCLVNSRSYEASCVGDTVTEDWAAARQKCREAGTCGLRGSP